MKYFYFSLWMNNTPLTISTTFSLSIKWLMGTKADSIAWLLWIVLLKTWINIDNDAEIAVNHKEKNVEINIKSYMKTFLIKLYLIFIFSHILFHILDKRCISYNLEE
jgi:hypothetical protein